MTIEQLDSSIKNSKNILLVSHINPDGDTLGAMCGMYSLIYKNYKKKCDMALASKVPSVYEFLPNISEAKNISQIDLSREYDLVINLDVASIDRCSDAKTLFEKAKNTVNIDHHETNPQYAKINIVEPYASATGEVIFGIAQKLNWDIPKDAAECLYVAIMTDTGCFRFSNTTSRAMKFCSKLLELGVNSSDLSQKCYESNSKDMVLFQSYCVNKAKFIENDKIAFTFVYKKDLERFNYNGDDFTEGLTEKLRAIKSTEIAFVVKELNSTTSKISMRSRSKDIAKVCSAFGGGGHKLAAGAVVKANAQDCAKLVIEEIKKQGLC